ncbi:hypothetical protein IB256_21100 [Pseudomonas sp. PDM17]|uniref:hypothetical protein n=1 Tax=Pseudomonas sp. PDM17 TaxID=2769285 RepID=UPI00177D83C8|nr:hypothetical protein [Pseudomonas sp. PDM17]MBD9503300.1 hypothetical protein [Pseudomonas sp. PDM17]
MRIFTERSTVRLDIKDSQGIQDNSVEKIIVSFNGGATSIDIGAFCYKARSKNGRLRGKPKLVDTSTICPVRSRNLRLVVEHFSNRVISGYLRPTTAHGYLQIVSEFMDFCDENFELVDFQDEVIRKKAVLSYTDFLEDLTKRSPRANNYYSTKQVVLINELSEMWCDDYVWFGVRRLQSNADLDAPVQPPDDSRVSKNIDMFRCLFSGYSNFVTSFGKFPFFLKLPNYIGAGMYIFPTNLKFVSPLAIDRFESLKNTVGAVDYRAGRIRSLDECESFYKNRASASVCRSSLLRSLKQANEDPQCSRRRMLGILAHNAFFVLFQANTGMNLSGALELEWCDEYTVEASRKKFRLIKYRASGREQSFEISATFLQAFKEFLKLRIYLLAGRTCSTLFFRCSFSDISSPVKAMRAGCTTELSKWVLKIDPGFEFVTSREWRAAKSDFLLQKYSVEVVSLALQNNIDTVEDHYAEGSEQRARIELSDYYSKLMSAVVRSKDFELTKISTGSCSDYGSPAASDSTLVEPDCKTDLGCLFCEKFRVHADIEDIRKLISCRYFISRLSYLNPSTDSVREFYDPALARINSILKVIGSHSDELNHAISTLEESIAVQDGLDPYWENRISSLIEVGVL